MLSPELTLDLDTEVTHPTLCESIMERETLHLPPHPASWFVRTPCGIVMAACEDRRLWAVKTNGVYCTPGCEADHAYDDLIWVPIKL